MAELKRVIKIEGYMSGVYEIRFTFDNDRNHAIMVDKIKGKEHLVQQLHNLAANIHNDDLIE